MPRRVSPFAPDVYYHFYNRGNNRQAVFFQLENYLYFLKGVKKYLAPVATIIAYCLMPTHYHILMRIIQTSEVSPHFDASEVSRQVSLAMQKFLISYTKAINKR